MTSDRLSAPAPLGRVVMVVPTYNEADNLAWIVAGSARHSRTCTCSSSTTTHPTARARSPTSSPRPTTPCRSCTAPRRAASARRTSTGFSVALDHGYDVIGEMDADGSHQPEQLHLLLDALRDADLVIGSRWIPGGSVVNWPFRRELLSRGGNLYVRLLLGVSVRDATAGYRLFRRSALEAIDLASVESTGYVFQTDMVTRCLRVGLRVREVPIEFIERVRGDSKMSGQVAVESLRRVTTLGAARASSSSSPGMGRR